MNSKIFDSIVGKKSLVNAARDSDRDGVINILDCRPYNPNKQGWIHDAASSAINAIKNKALQDRARDREERVGREVTRENARSAASSEREKQTIKTAKYRVQQEASQERARILRRSKMGGAMDYLRAAGREIHRPAFMGSGSSPTRKKVTTYVKKGKSYVKHTRYKSIKVGTQGNQENNAQQIHNVLGTNLRF